MEEYDDDNNNDKEDDKDNENFYTEVLKCYHQSCKKTATLRPWVIGNFEQFCKNERRKQTSVK